MRRSDRLWLYSSALTPFMVLPLLAIAQDGTMGGGIERIANPLDGSGRSASEAELEGTASRANCVMGALQNGTQGCPNPCMIAVSLVEAADVDVCALAEGAAWQCQWPRNWVEEEVSCSALGFGGGWTGTATIENEYEIQQCGSVVVPTGAPRRLIDTSGCERVIPESSSMACPVNGGSLPVGVELDPTLASSWQTEAARRVGWEGSGISLQRGVRQGLTPAGTIVTRSASAWQATQANCTRNEDTLLATECSINQTQNGIYTGTITHSPGPTCENTYANNAIHLDPTGASNTWQAGHLFRHYRFWQVHGSPLTRGCSFEVHPSQPLQNVDLRRTTMSLTLSGQTLTETTQSTQLSNLQTFCVGPSTSSQTADPLGLSPQASSCELQAGTTWNVCGGPGNSANGSSFGGPQESGYAESDMFGGSLGVLDVDLDAFYGGRYDRGDPALYGANSHLQDISIANYNDTKERKSVGTDESSNPGGDACVLCGLYYRRGELDRKTYVADLRYGQQYISANTMAGYHLWAVPLVRYLEHHPNSLWHRVFRPITRHWAQEMAYRMNASPSGSLVGQGLLLLVKPLCTLLGQFSLPKAILAS